MMDSAPLRVAGVWLATILAGGCKPVSTRLPDQALLTAKPVEAGLAIEAPVSGVPPPQRLFISGHSLTDRPLPDMLALLAGRSGKPLHWERQHQMGAPISVRSPAPIPTEPHDALLITEQHSVLGTMMWNDTEHYLREYHDAFVRQNPVGRTYFFVPWLSIADKGNLRDWIAYEQAAAPVWQCLVTRVNAGIAATGRSDRIVTIPASLAMAHLVERLEQGLVLPGISTSPARRPIDALIHDEVHLEPLAFLYIALVSHMALSGAEPASLLPLVAEQLVPEVTVEQGLAMLRVATEFHATRLASRRALDAAGCRQFLEQSFIDDYWAYMHRLVRPELGAVRAQLKTWRWKWLFARFFRDW